MKSKINKILSAIVVEMKKPATTQTTSRIAKTQRTMNGCDFHGCWIPGVPKAK